MSDISIVDSLMEQYGVEKNVASTNNNDIDKDAFLNLLATQMRYQDPLEPSTNEDMLAQMAQFSALEQMQNLNASQTMQQGYSLMGKTVIGVAESDVVGSSEYVQGTVESVTLKNGEVYLLVDGKDVVLGNVEAVLNEATTSQTELVDAIEKINATLETINAKIDALSNASEETSEGTTEEEAEATS